MKINYGILGLYFRYPAWPLLVYGFSAGLPFKVIFAVVALYLRELGFDLTTITLLGLLGLFYSLKFLWSPVMDRPPFAGAIQLLGLRRTSLLVIQLLLLILFVALACIDPISQWAMFAACLMAIAFLGASADIVIDALRIELADSKQQGILAANYLIGYRIGLIAGIAVPLYLAEYGSWFWGFTAVAVMLVPSLLTSLFIHEPKRSAPKDGRHSAWLVELFATMIAALKEFSQRYKGVLLWIIALALLYRFCDVLLGVVAYPFYADLGFSKVDIGLYSGVVGVCVTLVGGMIGGYLLLRMDWRKLLLTGLALAAVTNLMYVALAIYGHGDFAALLIATIVADNLSGGMATTAFIAWLSSLINLHFTAIQYALFSSLSTLPGKLVGAGSGWFIDSLESGLSGLPEIGVFDAAANGSLMSAYALFFAITALAGLPAWFVINRLPDEAIRPSSRAGSNSESD